ncbi:hypothetical protein PISMIDRAFT_31963, partial [Pisolithus microcarpus 441]
LRVTQVHPPFQHPRLPSLLISTHFFDQSHCVMFAFLDLHEVIAWKVAPWSQMFHHKMRTHIGSTAYHESSQLLLVWNLVDGVDIYCLVCQPTSSLHHVRHLRLKIRRNYICHVQFDSNGKVAITGTDNGQVLLWDIDSGQLAQVLHHG